MATQRRDMATRSNREKALMHECPRCGQPTDGAWSPGGLRWAICDECMRYTREDYGLDEDAPNRGQRKRRRDA